MNLIIEVGNTNLKVAVFDGDELIFDKRIPKDIDFDLSLIDNYTIKNAIKSGTGNSNIKLWNDLSCKKIEFNKSLISQIKIEYKTPDTLGEDRLLNAFAAAMLYPNRDILIIDCGTCITCTFIDKSKTLAGGSISPGLKMRLQSLHEFTFKLPLIHALNSDFDQLIGDNTESSILSGAYLGAVYEINARMGEYLEKFPNLSIIMTGGDADFFKNKIKSEIFVDSSLTLRGLNYTLNQI